jgi:hypothetical protein
MSLLKKKKSKGDKKEDERIKAMTSEELDAWYLGKGQWSWDLAWQMLHTDEWSKVSGNNKETGCVYCNNFPDTGKLYKLEGYVDISPRLLFEEMVIRVGDSPTWNEAVVESKVLHCVNDNTDICYNVAADVGAGIIAKRDFISVRHWKSKDGITISAGCTVLHPDMPPRNKIVRGENKPGGWIFQEIPGEPDRCIFMWLFNTDLKGWIPQPIIDSTIPRFLMEYLATVRKRAKTIPRTEA